jgi:hypothetical protein
MFGSDILVAAKVGDPTAVKNATDNSWTVSVALPVGATWYSFYSKAIQVQPMEPTLTIADD